MISAPSLTIGYKMASFMLSIGLPGMLCLGVLSAVMLAALIQHMKKTPAA